MFDGSISKDFTRNSTKTRRTTGMAGEDKYPGTYFLTAFGFNVPSYSNSSNFLKYLLFTINILDHANLFHSA